MARISIRVLGYFSSMGFFSAPPAAFADDLRDVKAPVAFPSRHILLWILLTLLIISAVVYFYYSRKGAKRAKKLSPEVFKTAWEKAYERLEALAQSGLLEQGDFAAYYMRLSDIIRRYMEDRFQIRAPEMTTEEFLNYLRNAPALNVQQGGVLADFLSSCDMVKFAKYLPRVEEARKNTQLARRIVDETKEEFPTP